MTQTITSNRAPAERFCELQIEIEDSGAITLHEPDHTGNGYDVRITLHPLQARRLGELAGLASNETAQTQLARLQRRVRLINERAADLAYWLASLSDHEHADLTNETIMANALADLTSECVSDFGEVPCQADSDNGTQRHTDVPRDNQGTHAGQTRDMPKAATAGPRAETPIQIGLELRS